MINHFKCGVWTYETDCINDMKEDFLHTEAVSEEIVRGMKIMRGRQRFIAEVLKVFSPMF